MQIRTFALGVFIVLLLAGSAAAQKFPEPPLGYSWVSCREINGTFLLPWGWYFKKRVEGQTYGYYFTRENIEEWGVFSTGLSINVIPNIPKKNNMLPSVYAGSFIEAAVRQKEIYKQPWQETLASLPAFGVVLLNPDPLGGDFISYNLAIANDRTGTLYLLAFESKAEEWERIRVAAGIMLKNFYLDVSF